MYFSSRAVRVRNLSVAAVNGAVTLVILLIAPLGLAAVVINTVLVTVASYFSAVVADWVVNYLVPQRVRAGMAGKQSMTRKIRRHPIDADLSDYD